MCKEYSGWPNKPTWAVNLWAGEANLHGYIQDEANNYEDDGLYRFADWLKDFLAEAMGIDEFQDNNASLLSDLLGWAWAMADIDYIARHYWDERPVDDEDKTDEDEEEEEENE